MARKRPCIALLVLMLPVVAWTNIRAINFESMPGIEQYNEEYLFIINRLPLLEEWNPVWKHEISREALSSRMEQLYTNLEVIESSNVQNIDIALYRGVLAHYLYNLRNEMYYDKAVQQFDKALLINPTDYRCEWFKAVHLAKASMQDQAFELFQKIAGSVPWGKLSPYFWTDYSEVAYLSGMPFNSIMGAKYAHGLLSEKDWKGYWKSKNLQHMISSFSIASLPNTEIDHNELFQAIELIKGNAFRSYQLGILVFTNDQWQYGISDYSNEAASFFAKPETYMDNRGKRISSTITVLMSTRGTFNPLEEIRTAAPKGAIIKKVELPVQLNGVESYEILSKKMYVKDGGAHLIAAFIRREKPKNPGVALESPIHLDADADGQTKYYALNKASMRFETPIYYVFLLDIAASVFEDALKDYLDFINNQILIE